MNQSSPNRQFVVDGGDGWADFFYSNQVFEVVETDWFDNSVDGQSAILALGVGGDFDGEYFAFTARTTVDFPKFLFENGWASILVHQIVVTEPAEATASFSLIWGRGMGLIVMLENGERVPLAPVLNAGTIRPIRRGH